MYKVNRAYQTIQRCESRLTELVANTNLSSEDENSVGYMLSSILNAYFFTLDKETKFKYWAIDDMYPEQVYVANNKMSLSGSINWLEEGSSCERYQADIAIDTDPILYSVKLKNKLEQQVLYIGKTFEGWVLNET